MARHLAHVAKVLQAHVEQVAACVGGGCARCCHRGFFGVRRLGNQCVVGVVAIGSRGQSVAKLRPQRPEGVTVAGRSARSVSRGCLRLSGRLPPLVLFRVDRIDGSEHALAEGIARQREQPLTPVDVQHDGSAVTLLRDPHRARPVQVGRLQLVGVGWRSRRRLCCARTAEIAWPQRPVEGTVGAKTGHTEREQTTGGEVQHCAAVKQSGERGLSRRQPRSNRTRGQVTECVETRMAKGAKAQRAQVFDAATRIRQQLQKQRSQLGTGGRDLRSGIGQVRWRGHSGGLLLLLGSGAKRREVEVVMEGASKVDARRLRDQVQGDLFALVEADERQARGDCRLARLHHRHVLVLVVLPEYVLFLRAALLLTRVTRTAAAALLCGICCFFGVCLPCPLGLGFLLLLCEQLGARTVVSIHLKPQVIGH
mmetsp:Transcript_42964/g.108459  ORF Transcript_42964/g.108459 Transcript_42964/m.108459 type:complete len:424 (-) Transcript_42964:607-1878(-)